MHIRAATAMAPVVACFLCSGLAVSIAPAQTPAAPSAPSMTAPRRMMTKPVAIPGPSPAAAPAQPIATPPTLPTQLPVLPPNGLPGRSPICPPGFYPSGILPTAQPQQAPYLIPSPVVGPNGPVGSYYPGVMGPNGGAYSRPFPAVSGRCLSSPVGSLGSVGHYGGARDGVVLSSGGFSAAGSVVGDNFRLGFTLGNNPFVVDRFGHCQSIINCGNICGESVVCTPHGSCVYPYYYYPYYNYGYGYGYSGQIYGSYSRIDNWAVDPFVGMGAPGYSTQSAAPAANVPARPMTAMERADFLLREGLAREAIEAFKECLKATPGDAEVIRHYAIALLVDRQPTEAAATMMLAYERDAERLAPLPIDPSLADGANGDIRGLVIAAVNHANSVKSASAWLMVAVLMQAEGRLDVALRQIEKAKAVGMPKELAVILEKALRPR